MTEKRKYLPIAAIAAVALVAAACSDNDRTPVATTPPAEPPAMVDACATTAACLTQAQDALKTAEDELAALKANPAATNAQVTAAEKAMETARMALVNAQAEHNAYVAMQAPTYGMKALAKAIGTAVGDTPASDPDVIVTIDGGMPPMTNMDYTKATWPVGTLAGFRGAVYEDKKAGTSVVTYTNKMAAKGAKFSAYYVTPESGTTTEAPTTDPTGYTYADWMGVASINDAGVLSLETDVTGAPISFPHGASADSVRTISDNADTADDEREIKGTFHEVPGTYACASDPCTVTTNAKGELITLSSGWTFTPDKNTGDMMVAGVLNDADYLDFGYWVTTADSPDGPTYAVGTFASGMTETTGAVMGALTGALDEAISATYKGGAAGLYAKREHSGTGDGDLMAAGRFTAMAELTAKFGTGDHTAVDEQNRISGMISNFTANGAPIDATWRVKLNEINFSASSDGSFGADADAWSGQFFGGTETTAPTAVAGEFDRTFDNGEVIGAFGATKQ